MFPKILQCVTTRAHNHWITQHYVNHTDMHFKVKTKKFKLRTNKYEYAIKSINLWIKCAKIADKQSIKYCTLPYN